MHRSCIVADGEYRVSRQGNDFLETGSSHHVDDGGIGGGNPFEDVGFVRTADEQRRDAALEHGAGESAKVCGRPSLFRAVWRAAGHHQRRQAGGHAGGWRRANHRQVGRQNPWHAGAAQLECMTLDGVVPHELAAIAMEGAAAGNTRPRTFRAKQL